jgi:hypothetical protein
METINKYLEIMNNILNISGRTVTINIEALSKGLHDLHAEDEDKKAVLAFGMLDHGLCELMETNLAQSIKKEFSPEANELFKERIETFISDVNSEIAKGVYQHAKMIV